MKKYKLLIKKYNIMINDYEIVEKIVITADIYHEIGYIYCTTIEDIKRIDYYEIKPEQLNNVNLYHHECEYENENN